MCTVSIYENIQLELCLRIYICIFKQTYVYTYVWILYIYTVYTYIHYIHMVAQDLRASTNSFWIVLESSKHLWKLQYIREICIYYNCFPPKDDENQLSKSLAILKNVPTVFFWISIANCNFHHHHHHHHHRIIIMLTRWWPLLALAYKPHWHRFFTSNETLKPT